MQIYVMHCGCRLKKADLLKQARGGYRCKKHPDGGIKHIEKSCRDCGATMILAPRSGRAYRCPACQLSSKQKRQKRADAKYHARKSKEITHATKKKIEEEKVKASQEAWNCRHRNNCIDKLLKSNPLATHLPCYGCERSESCGFGAAA